MNLRRLMFRSQILGTALLAASAVWTANAADYPSTVLSQGPVGYWRLDETTQPQQPITSAANLGSLGSSENGTYEGSQGFFRGFPGALSSSDTSIHFDGSSQDVKVPDTTELHPTANFSAEGWFKADASGANCIMSCGVFSSPRSGWLIYQVGTTGYELRMYNQNGTAVSVDVVGNAGNIVGVWTHVVATYDGTTARLYLNGVLKGNANPTGYVPGVGPFTVGERADGFFLWAGGSDEVAFYGSVLSASDVAAHYSAATTNAAGYATQILAKSPLVYMRFNEAGDPLAANLGSLGSGAAAAYSAGTTPGVPGPRPPYAGFTAANNAVSFDGSSGGSVTIPPLNLTSDSVTMTGWVNARGNQSTAAGLIFSRGNTTKAGLTIDAVYGGLGLGYNWNNDTATYNWSPSQDSGFATLPDSDWAFVALVVDPVKAAIYMVDSTNYLNFASVTNFPPTGHAPQSFDGSTLLGSDEGFTPTRYLNGTMDEVAIFNRALSAGEIYTEYAAAVGGIAPKIFNDPQLPTDPVYVGDTLSLVVDAGGTPNLSYQWRKGGTAISGATTSALSKPNVTSGDSGTYDVVITNPSGTKTSGSVAITVNTPFTPSITTPPIGHTLYPGGTLNLTVGATGGGLRYLWSKGGNAIAGATQSSYTIRSVVASDSGSYSVSVTNTLGAASGGPVTVSVITPSTPFETAIVNDGPEAWWRLDEASGSTMWDSMGRHDGAYVSTSGTPVTLGAAGAIAGSTDKAVTFDGTSKSYGSVPFSPNLNTISFSMECWVRPAVTTGELCPVSSRSSVPKGMWFYTYPAGAWSGGVSSGGNNYYVPSGTASDAVVAGEWKHLVLTYDPGTSLRMYVNGQWDGQGYVNFDRNASGAFIIGALGGSGASGTDVSDMFNGQVDEVIFYNTALTLAQIQNHYSLARFGAPVAPTFLVVPGSQEVRSNSAANITLTAAADGSLPITYQWFRNGTSVAGATTTALTISCANSNAGAYYVRAANSAGTSNSPIATVSILPPNPAFVNVTNSLVLHMKFDGDFSDSSGRGNNATAVGTPAIVAGRLGSGALYFDTSNGVYTVNNYLNLGTPADLKFGATTNFSVSYWVKTAAGQTNGDLPFFDTAINSYGNPGFTFAPSYKQGGWSYSLNGVVQVYGGPNSINNGNWHHVLHTFDRSGNALTYLDGAQIDSRLCLPAGDLDTPNPVIIGQDPTGQYSEDGSATLDDLAVWRRSLTAYEAYAVYYAATNGNLSFDTPGTVSLKMTQVGSNIQITWQPGATLGTLMQADDLTGPWTAVPAYVPSYTFTPTGARKFFRLALPE
jgi:hypothetical protein